MQDPLYLCSQWWLSRFIFTCVHQLPKSFMKSFCPCCPVICFSTVCPPIIALSLPLSSSAVLHGAPEVQRGHWQARPDLIGLFWTAGLPGLHWSDLQPEKPRHSQNIFHFCLFLFKDWQFPKQYFHVCMFWELNRYWRRKRVITITIFDDGKLPTNDWHGHLSATEPQVRNATFANHIQSYLLSPNPKILSLPHTQK